MYEWLWIRLWGRPLTYVVWDCASKHIIWFNFFSFSLGVLAARYFDWAFRDWVVFAAGIFVGHTLWGHWKSNREEKKK